jgi:hypothetical protein
MGDNRPFAVLLLIQPCVKIAKIAAEGCNKKPPRIGGKLDREA